MYNKTLNKNVFSLRNANEKQGLKMKLNVLNKLTKIIVFVIFIYHKNYVLQLLTNVKMLDSFFVKQKSRWKSRLKRNVKEELYPHMHFGIGVHVLFLQ
jgi:hypothetical protein